MEINTKEKKLHKLGTLEEGTVFCYDDRYYIMTDNDTDFIHSGFANGILERRMSFIVALDDGHIYTMDNSKEVEVPNCRLEVE